MLASKAWALWGSVGGVSDQVKSEIGQFDHTISPILASIVDFEIPPRKLSCLPQLGTG